MNIKINDIDHIHEAARELLKATGDKYLVPAEEKK